MTLNVRLLGVLVALLFVLTSGVSAQDEWADDDSGDEDPEAGDTGYDDDPEAGDFGDDDSEPDASAEAGGSGEVGFMAGEGFPLRILGSLKAGGGGSYQTKPTRGLGAVGSQPLDDGAGGWAAIIGVTVQATILEGLVGLQIGLLNDWGYSWSEYSVGNTDTEWGYEYSTWRFPLLLQLGTPGKGNRVSIGTGPEFAFGGDATVIAESTNGGLNMTIPAIDQGGTFWVFNLGAELDVAQVLVLNFDIHYAMNLGTDDDYHTPFADFPAKNDHELRLMLGLGYAYDTVL